MQQIIIEALEKLVSMTYNADHSAATTIGTFPVMEYALKSMTITDATVERKDTEFVSQSTLSYSVS